MRIGTELLILTFPLILPNVRKQAGNPTQPVIAISVEGIFRLFQLTSAH